MGADAGNGSGGGAADAGTGAVQGRGAGDGGLRAGTTIVAPATPRGTGAVAIVRLSGPRAFRIAERLTGVPSSRIPPRRLVRCTVRNEGGAEIDDGLVVLFPGPGSHTGEDVVELHLHGNPLLAAEACEAACRAGAVPAEPGEFTRRAFLNGKMDLTQAEGVADLVNARTAAAARAAMRQMRGGIADSVGPLRERLVGLIVRLEAAIDFSDEEDVGELSLDGLPAEIAGLRQALGNLKAGFRRGKALRDGAVVVLAGVANVGKSRLLNRLLGEERAIVSPSPGTTRDYLYGETEIGGVPVSLVDTAGLRDTDDPVEAEGVRRSRERIASSDLLLFVLDGSRPAEEPDREAYGEVAGVPHLLLLNKDDLPARETGERFAGAGCRGRLRLSAKTGEGMEALRSAVAAEIAPGAGEAASAAPLSRLRHLRSVEAADEAMARAERAVADGLPAECIASDFRDAAIALSGLIGGIAPEEVLDAVFGSFCIGK